MKQLMLRIFHHTLNLLISNQTDYKAQFLILTLTLDVFAMDDIPTLLGGMREWDVCHQ